MEEYTCGELGEEREMEKSAKQWPYGGLSLCSQGRGGLHAIVDRSLVTRLSGHWLLRGFRTGFKMRLARRFGASCLLYDMGWLPSV